MNFRSFPSSNFDFDRDIVVIKGNNGSGKTTLLEALYYGCYLRSFKTRSADELIRHGANEFFLQLSTDNDDGETHEIKIGISKTAKTAKVDEKRIKSPREILDWLRIVSMTEDDLDLIRGAPEVRRTFLNQMLILEDFVNFEKIKRHKKIAMNRMLLLNEIRQRHRGMLPPAQREHLKAWTEQLWAAATEIQAKRETFLEQLSLEVNKLLSQYFIGKDLRMSLHYERRRMGSHRTFEEFWKMHAGVGLIEECVTGRNTFGIQLDNFSIEFSGSNARNFASRGQQKLLVFLMKIAGITGCTDEFCILLDDFLTDLDEKRIAQAMELIGQHKTQTFITSPIHAGKFFEARPDVQHITI